MAFAPVHKAVLLVANTPTDITDGGLAASEGGTLMLNINNDTGADVVISLIAIVPNDETLERRHHWQSNLTISADNGANYQTILPMSLGQGDMVVVEANAAIPAQLNGEARL